MSQFKMSIIGSLALYRRIAQSNARVGCELTKTSSFNRLQSAAFHHERLRCALHHCFNFYGLDPTKDLAKVELFIPKTGHYAMNSNGA